MKEHIKYSSTPYYTAYQQNYLYTRSSFRKAFLYKMTKIKIDHRKFRNKTTNIGGTSCIVFPVIYADLIEQVPSIFQSTLFIMCATLYRGNCSPLNVSGITRSTIPNSRSSGAVIFINSAASAARLPSFHKSTQILLEKAQHKSFLPASRLHPLNLEQGHRHFHLHQ